MTTTECAQIGPAIEGAQEALIGTLCKDRQAHTWPTQLSLFRSAQHDIRQPTVHANRNWTKKYAVDRCPSPPRASSGGKPASLALQCILRKRPQPHHVAQRPQRAAQPRLLPSARRASAQRHIRQAGRCRARGGRPQPYQVAQRPQRAAQPRAPPVAGRRQRPGRIRQAGRWGVGFRVGCRRHQPPHALARRRQRPSHGVTRVGQPRLRLRSAGAYRLALHSERAAGTSTLGTEMQGSRALHLSSSAVGACGGPAATGCSAPSMAVTGSIA